MALSRYEKKRLALSFLELYDKFTGAKAINPERSGGDGTPNRSDSYMFVAMISFRNCFTSEQWYCLEALYRPDVRKSLSQMQRIGHKLSGAWVDVETRLDYYWSVASLYQKIMR